MNKAVLLCLVVAVLSVLVVARPGRGPVVAQADQAAIISRNATKTLPTVKPFDYKKWLEERKKTPAPSRRPGFWAGFGGSNGKFRNVAKKPVLYLYHPKNNTKISVELPVAKGDKLGTIYPAFNVKGKKAWNVVSNGDRVSIGNRKYSYLFWEKSINTTTHFKSGKVRFQHAFKGADSEQFLEAALTRFGFNEREKDDFITFWLPMLQSNEVNAVKFDARARVKCEKKAVIKPKPKQHIYLFMYFKAAPKGNRLWRKANKWQRTLKLHKKVNRKNNQFVAVEWGGVAL
jgi:hypothetical protein